MATATLIHTDEEIQKDVLAELKWDAQVQPNEIGVSVKDGVVTLTGWVDSYLKKWAAEDAAHRRAARAVRGLARRAEVHAHAPVPRRLACVDAPGSQAEALEGPARVVHLRCVDAEVAHHADARDHDRVAVQGADHAA